jgi:hypothetical protein
MVVEIGYYLHLRTHGRQKRIRKFEMGNGLSPWGKGDAIDSHSRRKPFIRIMDLTPKEDGGTA